MKWMLRHRWIQLLIRFAIGGVFVVAGVLKWRDPQAFADNIAAFRLLPDQLVNVVALGLPHFEILVGTFLILGRRSRAAALGVMVMSIIFAVALSSALMRGLNIDCGCFGGGKPSIPSTWLSLGRDLMILVGAVAIYRVPAEDASQKRRPDLHTAVV
ncbi:MAG: MauE/DoxX family redox-associated membrane protein [Chthoniobacter sp.]